MVLAFRDQLPMALIPLRVIVLFACTLVFSTMGIVLIAVGVHGPQVAAWIAAFLLLPSVILTRLGVPLALPFIHTLGIVSALVSLILQTGYYYTLLRLIQFVAGQIRRWRYNRNGPDS